MPIPTTTADRGDFVYNPRYPMNRDFAVYLETVDHLLAEQRSAEAALAAAPFSPGEHANKNAADTRLREFIAPYVEVFNIAGVPDIPAFLPVAEFFAEFRSISEPFDVLHCCLDLPLHTVQRFAGREELAALNAALDELTPLRWWRDTPTRRPCYLFGNRFWEIKPAEQDLSQQALALLFVETLSKQPARVPVVAGSSLQPFGPSAENAVTSEVRLAVWRRDRGRCAQCGSRQDLEFVCRPGSIPGDHQGPQDVRLLCRRCQSQQDDND